MDDDKLNTFAGRAYDAYCAAVGGVAFNGDLLPTWENFSVDDSKQKQADAWREAARVIVEQLDDDIVWGWLDAQRKAMNLTALEIYAGDCYGELRFGAYNGEEWLCTSSTRKELHKKVIEFDPMAAAKRRLERLDAERLKLLEKIGEE